MKKNAIIGKLRTQVNELKEDRNQFIEAYVSMQFKYENCTTCKEKTTCRLAIGMEEEEMLQTRCFDWVNINKA